MNQCEKNSKCKTWGLKFSGFKFPLKLAMYNCVTFPTLSYVTHVNVTSQLVNKSIN